MTTGQPVYILGGEQTDFSRNWTREDFSIYDMFKDVFVSAIKQVDIDPQQIEVAHVGNFAGELFCGQGLIGGFFGQVYPEIQNIPTSRHEAACASGSMATFAAMSDIQAGHYDIACVMGIEMMRNVKGKVAAEHLGAATWHNKEATDCDYPWPFMFNQIIDEYEKRHGINLDNLKSISQINFNNAQKNPNAQTRHWSFSPEHFTNDDNCNPIIEGQIRKMDCGQVTDGAACVFLASERAAKDYASKRGVKLQDIPRIKGWGHRGAPLLLSTKLQNSEGQPLIFPHAAATMQDALRRAGINHITKLQGLETHDCFSITEYMAIDHIGLTAPGESWKAIQEGRITKDGDFPINPSGGLIGLGHPVGATGVRMILDCFKQVSCQAGAYQIPGAENMATFNLGGSTTTCASFIIGILSSFSNVGYVSRRLFWKKNQYNHTGQTWLVTGASGGIGRAVVEGALKAGAKVIAVARSEQKLRMLKEELPSEYSSRLDLRVVDLSLQSEISRLLQQLSLESIHIDVLINNVGVLLDDMTVTAEGAETSFATNILNHYLLTETMLKQSMLGDQSTVVNVVSGGMYAVPLVIENLDIQSDQYNGLNAYAVHKRAQSVLTQHWRETQGSSGREFYAMHPGWADTQGVQTSLPTFRKLLKLILRDSVAGADTILWLAGERPKQLHSDIVWFDRKPRKTHYLAASMKGNASAANLVEYLRSRIA